MTAKTASKKPAAPFAKVSKKEAAQKRLAKTAPAPEPMAAAKPAPTPAVRPETKAAPKTERAENIPGEPPCAFTGKLSKVTLTIDRPRLSADDAKKLEAAQRAAMKAKE